MTQNLPRPECSRRRRPNEGSEVAVEGDPVEDRGAACRRLEVGQGATGVAAREPDQLVQGVVVDCHRPGEAALVGQATGHDLADRVVRQRLEGQQQRARQERRDDGEERAACG